MPLEKATSSFAQFVALVSRPRAASDTEHHPGRPRDHDVYCTRLRGRSLGGGPRFLFDFIAYGAQGGGGIQRLLAARCEGQYDLFDDFTRSGVGALRVVVGFWGTFVAPHVLQARFPGRVTRVPH